MAEDTVTTRDLAAAAGVSYRQLDYWIRTGHVRCTRGPSGSGNYRTHPIEEIPALRCVQRLITAGFGVTAAFGLARQLSEGPIAVRNGFALTDLEWAK